MNLANNTILITGGASGIGFALARNLVARGNRVIVCGRGELALTKARAQVPELITRVCDVADPVSRTSMVAWLEADHADLNILINNAGAQHRRDFGEASALDHLDEEVAINFTAPIRLIGDLLPLLRRQPEAVIVNVSSGLAFVPKVDVPVYCATKAALHSFTVSLRHQLKATGIRVVEMIPPLVDTGLGGGARATGATSQPMMSAEDFAQQALAQMDDGHDEAAAGMSINMRKLGEQLFERINGH